MNARCAQHAEAAASDVCIRCGTFLCSECLERLRDEPYCHRCLELVTRAPASARSIAAALLSGVALFGGLILWMAIRGYFMLKSINIFFVLAIPFLLPGIGGFALGKSEKKRVARRETSRRSALYANAAVLLGAVDLVMLGLSLAVVAYGLLR